MHTAKGIRSRWPVVALLSLLIIGGAWGAAPAQAAKGGGPVNIIRLGSASDVSPALIGPSLYLMGNGAPLPSAFQLHIDQVAGAPVDIVVLAASFSVGGASQSSECESLLPLRNVNSCETITITKAIGANDPVAAADVSRAEIVYFAGGDQCNYVGWKGTAVYQAILGVVARGGGIGGGSAGLAIQGDHVYDGCKGSASSAEALANPYDNSISFTHGYFDWPQIDGVFTDSHFVERNRMGRLMSYIARQIQDGYASSVTGLGIDVDTAVIVDKRGAAQVYGQSAYVVVGDHAPELCVAKSPLSFSNYRIWRLPAGSTYNFASPPTTGYYTRSVVGGVISADPYTP